MAEPTEPRIVGYVPAWVRCTLYADVLCSDHRMCRDLADAEADDPFPDGDAEW